VAVSRDVENKARLEKLEKEIEDPARYGREDGAEVPLAGPVAE
jgi:hypothetical protein